MITYKAPATLMLMGEHAVLHGKPAIATAINQFMVCTLVPRQDAAILIDSKKFGKCAGSLHTLPKNEAFSFVIESIRQFLPFLKFGFELNIHAEFSSCIGFGSSAAVTAATLSCLNHYTQANQDLMLIGKAVIKAVQIYGSGMDLMTCLTGGIVYADPNANVVEKIGEKLPLHALYSSYKTPTKDVIQHVNSVAKTDPDLFKAYLSLMTECTASLKTALQSQTIKKIGACFARGQTCFEMLHLTCAHTDACVQLFNQEKTIAGAKISGSGLGDCVIAIGKVSENFESRAKPYLYIPIECDIKGCHEIQS